MRTFLILTSLFFSASTFAKDALDTWYLRDARVVKKVRFVNGLFVGVGNNGTILTSSDGQTWTARSSGTTATLNDVCFGSVLVPPPGNGSRYIAVGDNATILISSNAINWSSIASANTCDLNGVAFGGSRFIAVATRLTTGQPNALTSSDGLTWAPLVFPNAEPNPNFGVGYRTGSILAIGGTFVAAGSPAIADEMWRSVGGNTWERASVPTGFTIDVFGLASGNGRTVAFGLEGNPLVSTNSGQDWFPLSTNSCVSQGNCLQGRAIAFGNATFLASGEFGSGTFRTTNGISWTKHSALSAIEINSLAFGNGTFVAAGPSGIYQSEPVSTPGLSITRESNDQIKITVSGEVGRAYRLQTSTAFSNWSDHSTFTNASPTMEFVESVATNATTFFRAVTP